MKRKKQKIKFNIKKLPKDSFILKRGKHGYVKTTRKNVNYILEVRHSKTKKLIGYINGSKKGKPVPRKFTNTKNFTKNAKTLKPKIKAYHEISINFKNLILDQMKNKGRDLVLSIQKLSQKKNSFLTLRIEHSEFTLTPETKEFSKQDSKDSIENEITHTILQAIKDSRFNIRTSPRKFAKKEDKDLRTSQPIILKATIT